MCSSVGRDIFDSLCADFQKRVVVSISKEQFSQGQFFPRWNPVELGLYLFLSTDLIRAFYLSLFRYVIKKKRPFIV